VNTCHRLCHCMPGLAFDMTLFRFVFIHWLIMMKAWGQLMFLRVLCWVMGRHPACSCATYLKSSSPEHGEEVNRRGNWLTKVTWQMAVEMEEVEVDWLWCVVFLVMCLILFFLNVYHFRFTWCCCWNIVMMHIKISIEICNCHEDVVLCTFI